MKPFFTVLVLVCVPILLSAQPSPQDTVWTRTFDAQRIDVTYSIQRIHDGGYIIAGHSYNEAPYHDSHVVRIDSNGNACWNRVYGDSLTDDATTISIIETHDSCFVTTGAVNSRFGIMKLRQNGDTMWTRTYGSGMGWSVIQTSDHNYVACGITSGTNWDWLIVKVNQNTGAEIWRKIYGGPGSEGDNSCIRATSDGGLVAVGITTSSGYGGTDAWLLRMNSSGDTVWSKLYGTGGDDYLWSLECVADGGFILAGDNQLNSMDVYIIRTDASGDTMWTRQYGGEYMDAGHQIISTPDGGFAIAASTNYLGYGPDAWLLKINSIGDTLWTRRFGSSNEDLGYGVCLNPDGSFTIGGATRYNNGSYDMYVVKTIPFPSVWITHPNGGEDWRILQPDTVTWNSVAYSGQVKLELNRNYPNGEWEILSDGTENDGWEPLTVTGPPATECRVRITNLEGNAVPDVSNEDFLISTSQGFLGLARITEPNNPVMSWDAGTIECPQTANEWFHFKNFGSETTAVLRPLELEGQSFAYSTDCDSFFLLAPGQMSTCSLHLIFDPTGEGIHTDTLLVTSDAVNAQGAYVRIPLSGERIATPSAPQVVITIQGINARLSWNPVTESVGGCEINVTHYLVFYSPSFGSPFYYHGLTTDTTYAHVGVVRYAKGMFYDVIATTAPLQLLRQLPSDHSKPMIREEVLGILHARL